MSRCEQEALAALRYAPMRHRWRLARGIMTLPATAFDQPPSVANDCQIPSLDQLEPACARLAVLLDRLDKLPAPHHRTNLETLLQHPRAYTGAISGWDCFFLTAMVSVIAPRRVVEIGTLTGFSAAVLAAAIIAERGYRDRPVIETIDMAITCLVAPEPIGFEIPQLLPQYPAAVRVHTGQDSRIVADLFAPGELSLAFIDANHEHPFPLLDLLRLAPFMQPGGWIMLHDILLGTISEHRRARGETLENKPIYGAEWLFRNWPFPKISGRNTGAIQLPQDRGALLPFALNLMRKPFEGEDARQHRKLRKMLYQALAGLIR